MVDSQYSKEIIKIYKSTIHIRQRNNKKEIDFLFCHLFMFILRYGNKICLYTYKIYTGTFLWKKNKF